MRLARVWSIACLLVVMAALPAHAADGDLDPTWGGDGTVTSNWTDFDWIEDLALASDGSVMAAGRVGNAAAVARYRPDGSLDPAYGTGGLATAEVSEFGASALGVSIQPDGKAVVAAGHVSNRLTAVRFNRNGSVDPTFGVDGVAQETDPWVGTTNDLALQDDGGILVVGSGPGFSGGFGSTRIVRFLSNGQTDPTFGTQGIARVDGGEAFALAVQSNGSVLAAGYRDAPDHVRRIAVFKVRPDGQPDQSFGASGVAVGPPGHANGVVTTPSGDILVAGISGGDVAVVRFTSAGSLDTTFGAGGAVISSFGSGEDVANAVQMLNDGRIAVAGSTCVSNCGHHNPNAWVRKTLVLRLAANGTPDPTFGTGGAVMGAFGPHDEQAAALALLPDGRILVGGYTCPTQCALDGRPLPRDFALARFTGTGGGPSYPGLEPGQDIECTITGTDTPDLLIGTPGPDVICGLGNHDVIHAGAGADYVLGGYGNDVILGMAGADRLHGGPDQDVVVGGAGPDELFGGDGDDLLFADDQVGGNDHMDGGPGRDVCAGDAGPPRDTRTDCEPLLG